MALARARHWPEERVLRELVEAAAVTGEGSTVLPPWLEGLPSDGDATWQQRRDWLCREMVRVMARRANPDGAAGGYHGGRRRPWPASTPGVACLMYVWGLHGLTGCWHAGYGCCVARSGVLAELRSRPVAEDRELYVEVMAGMLEQGRKDRAVQVGR